MILSVLFELEGHQPDTALNGLEAVRAAARGALRCGAPEAFDMDGFKAAPVLGPFAAPRLYSLHVRLGTMRRHAGALGIGASQRDALDQSVCSAFISIRHE
ncbi:MAG: hypothetical protein AB7P76_13345 [Candidatus Melainabacteria bacterium]